eukprot:Selendium_serpulae@DN5848_c0_g1_i4.p1
MKLFKRGQELAAKCGLILIDTKYEFGLDNKDNMFVIDEVNTPDSSRYCDEKEWKEKCKKLEARKAGGVSVETAVKEAPELAIVELSKQYVRDILISSGQDKIIPGSAPPTLTEEQIIEASYRYLSVYERFTGEKLELATLCEQSPCELYKAPVHHGRGVAYSPSQQKIDQKTRGKVFHCAPLVPHVRLVQNMIAEKAIKGCCVAILAGSGSDLPHVTKISDYLNAHEIPNHLRICSAHKQPTRLETVIKHYNKSSTPLVIVACAGGTDALSGTASFLSHHPVISCPPPPSLSDHGVSQHLSPCLTNPPGSSNATISRPENVARFALQVFSCQNPMFVERLQSTIDSKIRDLECADEAQYTVHMKAEATLDS